MHVSSHIHEEIPESIFWSKRLINDRIKGHLSNEFVRMCWRNHYTNLPDWDGSNLQPGTEERRRCVLEVLKESLVGTTVLEVGAGRGFYSNSMRKWGYEVTATDFAVGDDYYDVTKKPYGSAQFDNVVAIGMLHHIMNWKRILNAIRNIKQMALRRIIVTVVMRDRKPSNNIQVWPLSLYYDLGELIRQVEHVPDAAILIFDSTKWECVGNETEPW